MSNYNKKLDCKTTASGVPQVTEEGTQAGIKPKGERVKGPKTDLVGLQGTSSGGSGNADPPGKEAVTGVSQKLKGIHITPRKPSGAQRRKLAKLKVAEAGKEWIPGKDWRERGKGQKTSRVVNQPGGQGIIPSTSSDGAGIGKEARVVSSLPPETSQTPKRPRSEVSTPSSASGKAVAQGSKRVKLPEEGPTGSFRDALCAQKMAIVLDSYPNDFLSEEQADLLQQKLVEEICSEKCTGSIGPRFRSCFLSKGALILACEGEDARLWLERVVPELRLGEGAKLRVGPARDIVRAAKVAMWVPGALKNTTPSVILDKLLVQNEGLDIAEWRLLNRKIEPKGQTLVFEISEQALSRLKGTNFEVFLGLEVVRLRVVSKTSTSAAAHDPPESMEVASGEPPSQ
uniref:DUF4780 domain-containing protein n=1 Tax=Rhodnius prolixus TaxID=13249 RepID=T1HYW1_RHOPR